MSAELHSVTAESVTLRVATEPGTLVSYTGHDESTIRPVGPEGHVDFTIPRARFADYVGSGTGTNGRVHAFEDTLFGLEERHPSASFELPFDIRYLTSLTLPEGSWLRLVALPGSECQCVELVGDADARGLEGGVRLGDATNTFFAPPGSEVVLGPLAFTVPELGLHTETVDMYSLLAALPVGDEVVSWPVRVASPGQPVYEARASIRALAGCRALVRDALASGLQGGQSWPGGGDQAERFAVWVDRTGATEGFPSSMASSTLIGGAAFVAVETVIDAVEDERECHIRRAANYVFEFSDGSTSDDSVSIDRRPIRHRTRVDVYRTSDLERIATHEFTPPRGGCEEEYFPNEATVDRWVSDQLRRALDG